MSICVQSELIQFLFLLVFLQCVVILLVVLMNYKKIKLMLDIVFPTCRKLLVEKSLKRISFLQFNDVLIVGAGRDPYRYMFSKTCRYVTLDVSYVPGVTQIVADAHVLPVPKESFDCILASEVFEHLHDPVDFINKAYEALKPGGHLILTVPFMFHQHADPFDYWRPTKQTLIEKSTLFSSCEVCSQGNRLHAISDLVTTAFYPNAIFYFARILNHLLCAFSAKSSNSTAPTGFLAVMRK